MLLSLSVLAENNPAAGIFHKFDSSSTAFDHRTKIAIFGEYVFPSMWRYLRNYELLKFSRNRP